MNTAFHPRRNSFTLSTLALGMALVMPASSWAQNEIAHWTLDQTGSPYANTDNVNAPLLQDTSTSTAGTGPGIAGNAAQLQFTNPGPSTRLATATGPQTSNSFGFSIFIQPTSLNGFDSFIQKEAATTTATDGFAQLAWQVHLLGNNGSGQAPVELVVRGEGTGFAAVQSGALLTLAASSTDFYNIAGGYNATTGAISLYVRDVTAGGALQSFTGNGDTNIFTADNAPFSVGTGKYQGSAVTFAASTFVDEVRLYDAPLSAAQVMAIEAAVPEPGTSVCVLTAAGLAFLVWRRQMRAA